jgi:hypothetical protein
LWQSWRSSRITRTSLGSHSSERGALVLRPRPLSPKCQESRQPRSARRGSRTRLDLAGTDPGLAGRRPVRLPVCGACRELPAG